MRQFSFTIRSLGYLAFVGVLLIAAHGTARPPGSGLTLPSDEPTPQTSPETSPPGSPPASDFEGKEIGQLKFSGLRRVEADAVRAILHQKSGSIFSHDAIADDLHSIFGMGYFSDAQIAAALGPDQKVEITWELTEKPAIHKVTYEGNDELSNDDLKDLIDIKPYSILDLAAVRRNQRKIHDKYVEKGFYLADLSYKLVPVAGNETDVVYQIHEHAKVEVRRIQFVGNARVPSSDLQGIMQTQPGGWFSFLSPASYREEMLEHDLMGVQSIYLDRGFINVRVSKPRLELSPDKRYIYITIHVDEGEQYRLGKIDFSGDLLLPREELYRRVSSRPHELFNRSKLVKDRGSLDDVAQDQGYAYANITPVTAVNEELKTVDLTFDTQKGKPVYVERIEVAGNTKTRDKVIRRELRIYEGELFSGVALRASKARVQALGYFETVEVTTKKGSADDLILVTVTVKERPTGTFQVGAGFSTLESFIFTAQLSQNNLFGWGQTGSVTLQLSSLRQFVQLQFQDPYFLDTKLYFGVDVFRTQLSYVNFLRNATGFDLNFGYPLSEATRHTFVSKAITDWLEDARLSLAYSAQDVGVSPVFQGTQQQELANQFGTYVLSSLRLTLTIDKRDNRLYPSDGYMLSQSFEVAPSFLGSGFQFARYSGYARYYRRLFWGLVFKTQWTYGIIDALGGSQIPLSEQYFVGGINSLRGYYLLSVSPTKPVGQRTPDSVTSNFEVGGNKEIVINNEIEFPIVDKIGIRGVVFYDLGDTYSSNESFFQDKQYPGLPLGMLHSVGFGVRWFSPIGPLRFEWGFPLTPRPQDGPYDFEFTIGNFF
jgi:outer membrane protein insertion porin family